jgi:DNA helicase-2/ATP-dependent DNA helicase PcrA
MHRILASLNNKQREAVQIVNGPLLVLAGAGSGKTKTLVHRIAYLIDHEDVKPQNILAVTFTNKAAQEMKKRVKTLLDKSIKILPIMGTFHAICVQILHREIKCLNYKPSFVIYDENDSLNLLKKIVKEIGYDQQNFSAKAAQILISRAKNDLLDPVAYSEQAGEQIEQMVARIYEQYQRELKECNALDFDDLIMKVVEIFQKYPEILNKYQTIFKYILIDEYQDTNHAQYILVKLLADKHHNLCVIGDDFQSIYAWRGARMKNILNFEKDYPDTKVVLLEQNYRSTKNILHGANEIIKYNVGQKEKILWTENPTGSLLTVKEAEDERGEAEFIINKILDLPEEDKEEIVYEPEDSILEKILKSKTFKVKRKVTEQIKRKIRQTDFSQYVVLYRTNAQSRALEEGFLEYGIPYRIIGGIKFYERKEIKDMLAYLRLLVNPADWVSLERIINEPARGIGPSTEKKLEKTCREKSKNILEIKKSELNFLQDRSLNAVLNFQKIIQELAKKYTKLKVGEIIDLVAEKTGYKEYLLDGTEEGENRWANVQEIKTVAKKYNSLKGAEGLHALLEEVSLVSDQDEIDEDIKAVNLMTIHSAKGLEFPVVFVVGMEEGLFPHSRSLFDPEELEEERRLCYVAVTRAKKRLYLVHAQQRTIFGATQNNEPSRFLGDLPQEIVEKF